MDKILEAIREKGQMIILVTLITGAIIFSITAFIPPKYSSKISVIVIQKQASDKVDAFAAAKSAEYLSDIFSKVIYSDSFVNDVIAAPYEINKSFSQIPEERKKQWEKSIDVKKENNTGIIQITVLDPSRKEAEGLAQAIAWSLSVRGHKYHGGGDRIKIELIDGPITSIKPSSPNLLLNTLLGLVVGLVGAVSLAFYFEDFNLKLFRSSATTGGNGNWIGEKIRQQFEGNFPTNVEDEYEIEKKDYSEDEELIEEVSGADFIDAVGSQSEPAEEGQEEVVESTFVEDSAYTEVLADKSASQGEKELSDREDQPVVYEEIKEEEEVGSNGVSKKGTAPENLPIFMDENEENGELKTDDKGFVEVSQLEENRLDKNDEMVYSDEPSENEVKERLNKLLKGDL